MNLVQGLTELLWVQSHVGFPVRFGISTLRTAMTSSQIARHSTRPGRISSLSWSICCSALSRRQTSMVSRAGSPGATSASGWPADPCMLSRARGRRGTTHRPIHFKPEQAENAWASCTLTQMPDARWRARFTDVPDFVSQRYNDSAALRKRHKSLLGYARPCNSRTISVAALICWWAYGPPRDDRDMATHFVCGQHRCLNPRHIGWATAADNARHYRRHQQTLHSTSPADRRWPKPRRASPPPRRLRQSGSSEED